MSELTKKIAAIALTFALAFSVMGLNVTVADEHDDDDVTAEELLTQIQGLQQLIAQLQGGQTTTPTTPTAPTTGTPAACAAVTSFARNLTLGSSGADVKCLQALLNADPVTQVAASGVGSAGQESEYFGPLTRAAVISFQNKYSSEVLAPVGLNAGTGFVGTQTRAKLNTMLTTGVPGMPGVPTAPDFMTQLQAIADDRKSGG